MYLMIENSIRGGISTISNRYSKSNNPLLEDFDPSEPTTYITYLDANNLYGSAQSEPLPVGDFKFLTSDEIYNLDLVSILMSYSSATSSNTSDATSSKNMV